jgi:plastocyanin
MIKAIYFLGGRVPLPKTGRVAFSVIIFMGAVTGVLSYILFNQASPGPIFMIQPVASPSTGVPSGTMQGEGGTTFTPKAGQQSGANSTEKSSTSAIPPGAVTINILQGASAQGNPAYDPETAQASIDKTVAWKNEDSTVHTATAQDKSFDSSMINPGDSYIVPAKKIGAGEHQYSCTIHPYMKGTIAIK